MVYCLCILPHTMVLLVLMQENLVKWALYYLLHEKQITHEHTHEHRTHEHRGGKSFINDKTKKEITRKTQ